MKKILFQEDGSKADVERDFFLRKALEAVAAMELELQLYP
jgi:hypothetical protein